MSQEASMDLIYRLRGFPNETEWIEFKRNLSDPEVIAQDVSALANSAALADRSKGYLIWGVDDATHDLVGTSFNPYEEKAHGNQLLQPWLRSHVPHASYHFTVIEEDAGRFVILTVDAAIGQPVTFDDGAYIRKGNATMRTRRGGADERELWHRLQRSGFETSLAMEGLTFARVRELLDLDAYFRLTGNRQPENQRAVVQTLVDQDILVDEDSGRFSITNLGAILLARNIRQFGPLAKRAIRVVHFEGDGNIAIRENREFAAGYALSLPDAESFIMSVVPGHEAFDGSHRYVEHEFPMRAVRELLHNAVIHQDLTDTYSGPFIGIHPNRIEFSNPGKSLIEPERVLNAPPKTRNAKLAGILRQMDLCEEGGTGWDLIIESCEAVHLPAPKMRSSDSEGTLVVFHGAKSFREMTGPERLDAVYWHACLRYAEDSSITNQTLRERLGLEDDVTARQTVSRLLRSARSHGLIRPAEDSVGKKMASYVPFWA